MRRPQGRRSPVCFPPTEDMHIYNEHRCFADFSIPAWERLSTVCSLHQVETIERVLPPGWNVTAAEPNIDCGYVRVRFSANEPLWKQAEFEPLFCIGRFSSGGDEAPCMTVAARALHDALQSLFVRAEETEGR